MTPNDIHDFQIYRKKYLNIFTLPSLSRVLLQWKGTSYTVAVHPIYLCNLIINWDHVTYWLAVVKWRVIKIGSNAHASTSVLREFQKNLPWLKLFIQVYRSPNISQTHTHTHTPDRSTVTSEHPIAQPLTTQHTIHKIRTITPLIQWDSNQHSQQSSFCRPTP